MFANYFGHYLVEKGELTKEKLLDIKEAQKSARIKVGLLAVASGILSQKQADEVNMLQQQKDKRFGDIAIEKGYMTEEQVNEMLLKQGDSYMTFVQIITDKNIMTLEELQNKVLEFKEAYGYSDAELEDIKSGDLDRIVPIFMKEPALSGLHKKYIELVMRNLMRFIDTDIRMENVVQLQPMRVDCVVKQQIYGDQMMFTSISGGQSSMLNIASIYGKEDFTQIDADSLDAIGELLNVSNGLFVSAESEEGIELDLHPPVMYPETRAFSSEGIAYMIPIYLSGQRVNVVFSVNTDVDIA